MSRYAATVASTSSRDQISGMLPAHGITTLREREEDAHPLRRKRANEE
jgi:hypothetical protein